jgi:hypothetical protein
LRATWWIWWTRNSFKQVDLGQYKADRDGDEWQIVEVDGDVEDAQ